MSLIIYPHLNHHSARSSNIPIYTQIIGSQRTRRPSRSQEIQTLATYSTLGPSDPDQIQSKKISNLRALRGFRTWRRTSISQRSGLQRASLFCYQGSRAAGVIPDHHQSGRTLSVLRIRNVWSSTRRCRRLAKPFCILRWAEGQGL